MTSDVDWAALSDGALADHLYSNLAFDAEAEEPQTKAIAAEVDRRGLTADQLKAAWDTLSESEQKR